MKRCIRPGLMLLFALWMTAISPTVQAATISGTVTQASNSDITEALNVSAYLDGSVSATIEVALAPDGHYTLDTLLPGRYRISVDTLPESPYLPAHYNIEGTVTDAGSATLVLLTEEASSISDINLTLRQKTSISGFIIDPANIPLGSATIGVWLNIYEGTPSAENWQPITSTSPDNGRFSLTGLPHDTDLFIRVNNFYYTEDGNLSADSNEAHVFRLAQGDEPINGLAITLPSGRIEGSIVDEMGNPIPHMNLDLYLLEGENRQNIFSTQTNEAGAYTFAPLPEGRYTIRPGYSSDYPFDETPPIDITGKNSVSIPQIQTVLGASISGSIVGDESDLSQMLHISVCAGAPCAGHQHITGTSPYNGTYTLTGLPHDTDLFIMVSNFYYTKNGDLSTDCNQARIFRLSQGDDPISGLTITLPTGAISGTVVDKMGSPLRNMNLDLCLLEGENRQQITSTQTDETGAYTFAPLLDGSYTVSPDYNSDYLFKNTPAIDITDGNSVSILPIQAVLGASISGTIMGDGSTLPQGLGINIYKGSPCAENWQNIKNTITDKGAYTLSGLPHDTDLFIKVGNLYCTEKGGLSFDCSQARIFHLAEENGSINGLAITIPSGSIEGHVSDQAGTPVEGVDIYLSIVDGHNRYWVAGVRTDSDGNYHVPGLPDATYEVRLDDNSPYFTQDECIVTVTDSQPSTAPLLQIYPGASISGSITYPDAASGEAQVEIFTGDPCDDWEHIKTTRTSQGLYTLEGLPLGEPLFIRVRIDGSGNYAPGLYTEEGTLSLKCSETKIFTLQAGDEITGEEITLDAATATLSGQILDPEGNPADRIRVVVSSDHGCVYRESDSGSDGYFLFDRLPAGNLELQIMPEASTRFAYEEIDLSLTKDTEKEMDTIVLERGYRVSGVFHTTSGEALADKELEIEGPWETPWSRTQGDGSFELILRPGRYSITVEEWQLSDSELCVPRVFTVSTEDMDLGPLTLIPKDDSNRVEGTITGTMGENYEIELVSMPLTKANIGAMRDIDYVEAEDLEGKAFTLYGEPGNDEHHILVMDRTEGDGIEAATVIASLPVGSVPQSGLSLTLDPTPRHTITGRVIQNDRSARGYITLWKNDTTIAGFAELNNEGIYTLYKVPEESYTVYFIGTDVPDGATSAPFTVANEDFTAPDFNPSSIATPFTLTTSVGNGGTLSPVGPIAKSEGSSQTFTLTPDTGYLVESVTAGADTVTVTNNQFTLTDIQNDIEIVVTFKAVLTDTFTLTPSAGDNGTITPATPVVINDNGSQAFTVSPDAHYRVLSFTAGGVAVVQDSENHYTVSHVTEEMAVRVEFTPITFTITASAGTGGTLTPSGAVTVQEGSDQRFTLTPNDGYELAELRVDGTPVTLSSNHTFTGITADHTLSVTFKKKTYTITLVDPDNGTLTCSESLTVDHGESLTLTATPDATYETLWVQANGTEIQGNGTLYTLPDIQGNQVITAAFAQKTHTLTASAGTGGTLTPSGAVTVQEGSDQRFTLTPNDGYELAELRVDGTPITLSNSYTFTGVTADHTLSVSFKKKTYTVRFETPTHGRLTPDGEQIVEHGDSLTLTATPDATYETLWVQANGTKIQGNGTLYTLPDIQGNQIITAAFTQKSHTLTASAGPGGTIDPTGETRVEEGASKTFTISPAAGYQLEGMTVDGATVGVVSSYTFETVTAAHTIAASFTCMVPTATLIEAPTGTINTAEATFTIAGTNIAECRYLLDGGEEKTTADSTIVLTEIDDGEHTFSVYAVSGCGTKSASMTATWTVDTIPPVAKCMNAPQGLTRNKAIEIRVTGAGVVAYDYTLDAMENTDPIGVEIAIDADLTEGAHRLEVYGIDAAGNKQILPTVTTWNVDTTVPTAILTNAPADGSVTGTPTLTVQVGGEGVTYYRYALNGDDLSRILPVDQPIATTEPLADNDHTLSVVGVDAAGNWQTEATTITWTVDTTVPTAQLSSLPSPLTKETDATIEVDGEGITAYKFSLDGDEYPAEALSLTDPIMLTELSDGAHTLAVIAKGANDTWQQEATRHTWAVDTEAPGTPDSLSCNPGTPATTRLDLSWSVPTSDIARYELRYVPSDDANAPDDKNRWWNRATPVYCDIAPAMDGTERFTLKGLIPGPLYHVGIKAVDKAGNISDIAFFGVTSTSSTLPGVTSVIFAGGATSVDNGALRTLILTGENFTGETDTVRFVGDDRTFDLSCQPGESGREKLTVEVPKGTPAGAYQFRVIGQNGASALTKTALAIKEAPTPLPMITRIAPATLATDLNRPEITITGKYFNQNGAVEMEGLDIASYEIVDAQTITVILDDNYQSGHYAVQIYGDANKTDRLTTSTLKLEIYTPVALTADTGTTTTSTGATMPEMGNENEGVVPIQLTLTTDKDEKAPVISENPAEIAARIEPGTEITLENGTPYTGTIDPPRQMVVPPAMNLEPNAVVFTLGNPDEKLKLGDDQFIFVTIDTVIPYDTAVPRILYYDPAYETLTPAGVGEDSKGTPLTRDGVTITQGGTVLATRENTPEVGLKTLTYGLYLNHMSTYVAGSVKPPEVPSVNPDPAQPDQPTLPVNPTPTIDPGTPGADGGGSGCFIQTTGHSAGERHYRGLLFALGLLMGAGIITHYRKRDHR